MPPSTAVPHFVGCCGSKDSGDSGHSCSRITAMRGAKLFKKARRAKFSVSRLPELAALLVNWIICFQKEKEVERNSVERKEIIPEEIFSSLLLGFG